MTKRGKNCLKLFITSSKYEPTLQRCNGCQNICQVGHPTYNFLRILHAIITATSLINNTSKMFLSIKQPETESRKGFAKYHSPAPPTRFISSSLILHLIRLFFNLTQNYQVIQRLEKQRLIFEKKTFTNLSPPFHV